MSFEKEPAAPIAEDCESLLLAAPAHGPQYEDDVFCDEIKTESYRLTDLDNNGGPSSKHEVAISGPGNITYINEVVL